MRTIFLFLTLIILADCNSKANAQDPSDPFWAFNVVREHLSNPYEAFIKLLTVDTCAIGLKNRDYYWQALMTNLCFLGDIRSSNEIGKKNRTSPFIYKKDVIPNDVRIEHPRRVILEKSKEADILMLNEAHLYPQNRIFLKSILKDLYNLGFENLYMEDLASDNGLKRGFPLSADGFYINESSMGELVREAIRIGFNILSYDSASDNRDYAASENIVASMQKHANKKSIIFCGFSHANKKQSGTVAYYLSKSLPDYNILTIDQTVYMERENSVFYSEIIDRYNITSPSVILSNTGEPIPLHDNHYDIYIISPPSKFVKDRPVWIWEDNREEVVLNTLGETAFIEVYYSREANVKSAIPIERLLIREKKENISLLLPKGYDFVCKYYDKNGIVIKESKL